MWRVVLRSPANDVSEEVALDGPASVAELRRIVSSSFPGHPAPETVRLFLSGRLLREGDSVEGTEGEALVVHVVAPAGKVATSTPVARAQAAAVAPVVQEQQQKQHDQEERHPQQQQQPQHEDAVPVLPLPQAPVPPAQNRLRVGLLLRLAALVLLLAQVSRGTEFPLCLISRLREAIRLALLLYALLDLFCMCGPLAHLRCRQWEGQLEEVAGGLSCTIWRFRCCCLATLRGERMRFWASELRHLL